MRSKRSPIWLSLNDQEFEALVMESPSVSAILGRFGLVNKGGNQATVWKRISYLGIGTPHLERGRGKNTSARPSQAAPLDEILQGLHPDYKTGHLKQRLFAAGLKENCCEECGSGPFWAGKPLVCQLEHKNGNSRDHRFENLKILCPNCHSQTATFAGRSRRPSNLSS